MLLPWFCLGKPVVTFLRHSALGALCATIACSNLSHRQAHVEASLTIAAEKTDDVTLVTLGWDKPLAPGSLIVVNLQSEDEHLGGAHIVEPGSVTIPGIVLMRSPTGESESMLRLNAGALAESMGGSFTVVTARIVDQVEVHLLEGDPTVRGGMRVTKTLTLTATEQDSPWRWLCGGGWEIVSRGMPEARPDGIDAPLERSCRVTAPEQAVRSTATRNL